MPIVGVGVDLIDAPRIARLVSRNEDIFRSRILGERERAEISPTVDMEKRVHSYACSIAAKEAFLKALGTGLTKGMRWSDIEILNHSSRTPQLAISGEAARVLALLEGNYVQVSVCSRRTHALAIVMLTRNEAARPSL
jgi:holo-[acyl-carrier protein] synthase